MSFSSEPGGAHIEQGGAGRESRSGGAHGNQMKPSSPGELVSMPNLCRGKLTLQLNKTHALISTPKAYKSKMKVGASQKEIIGATSRLHVYSRIPAFFYNRHLMIRVLIHSACSEANFY